MPITVRTHARITIDSDVSFQNIREVRVKTPVVMSDAPVKEKLCASFVRCQTGGPERAASQCLQCPRLVNFVPEAASVHIRCLWTEADRVGALMTCETALVTVSSDTLVSTAKTVALENALRHLLVVDDGSLCGVLSISDLDSDLTGHDRVAERVNPCPWVIGPTASLGQAAALMQSREIGVLPVVVKRQLVGVLTRGDLRCAGVAEALLVAA